MVTLVIRDAKISNLGMMVDAKLFEDGGRNIKAVLVIGMLYDITFRGGVPSDPTYLKMCPKPYMNLLFSVISTFDRSWRRRWPITIMWALPAIHGTFLCV